MGHLRKLPPQDIVCVPFPNPFNVSMFLEQSVFIVGKEFFVSISVGYGNRLSIGVCFRCGFVVSGFFAPALIADKVIFISVALSIRFPSASGAFGAEIFSGKPKRFGSKRTIPPKGSVSEILW